MIAACPCSNAMRRSRSSSPPRIVRRGGRGAWWRCSGRRGPGKPRYSMSWRGAWWSACACSIRGASRCSRRGRSGRCTTSRRSSASIPMRRASGSFRPSSGRLARAARPRLGDPLQARLELSPLDRLVEPLRHLQRRPQLLECGGDVAAQPAGRAWRAPIRRPQRRHRRAPQPLAEDGRPSRFVRPGQARRPHGTRADAAHRRGRPLGRPLGPS